MFEDNIQSCSSSSELSLVVEEKRESLNFETEILIFFLTSGLLAFPEVCYGVSALSPLSEAEVLSYSSSWTCANEPESLNTNIGYCRKSKSTRMHVK